MPNKPNKNHNNSAKAPKRIRMPIRKIEAGGTTITRVSRPLGPFDEKYCCFLKMDSQSSVLVGAATVSQSLVYKANALYNVGPQVDYAGGFSTNYPTGLKYLLGLTTTQPATAPYAQFRVRSSRIHIELVNNAATGMNIAVFPMFQPSASGLSASNVREQSRCVYKYVPASTNVPITKLSNQITVGQMYGLNNLIWEANPNFAGLGASTDPSSTFYWNVVCSSNDATTLLAYVISVRIVYEVEFFGLNNLTTAAPTLVQNVQTNRSSSSTQNEDEGYIRLKSSDFDVAISSACATLLAKK